MERDFKGIWITKEIWLSKDLTLQEKVFLVEIQSLDGDNGCYASNQYFSDFFGVSKRQTSRTVNSLIEKGHLNSTLIYKKGTKEIEKRVLTKTSIPYGQKCPDPIDKSVHTPIDKSVLDNNTVLFNNTVNNKKQSKKDFALDKFKDQLKDFWCDKLEESIIGFIENRIAQKVNNTTLAVKKLCNRLKELSAGIIEDMIKILDNSIMNGWKGLFELKQFNGHSSDLNREEWIYREDIAESCNSTEYELHVVLHGFKEAFPLEDPKTNKKDFIHFCNWSKQYHTYPAIKTASAGKMGKRLEKVLVVNVNAALKTTLKG